MKITPLDEYQEPKYPPLRTVERNIHSAALTGKKAATFAMAVATAMTLTTCGAKTQTQTENQLTKPQHTSVSASGETTVITNDTTNLTYAGGEITPDEPTTAGIALVEETSLAGDVIQTDETQTTYDPGIAGSIVAPESTILAAGN